MDPTLVPNHIASNIVTKGILNISVIDRGILVPNATNYPYQYRKGGGIPYGYPERKPIDPSAILINIDWFKKVSTYKIIKVDETISTKKNFQVEMIQENTKPIMKIEVLEVKIN